MVENVTPKQAWETLLADPDAQLVDVRTEAEWHHVGVPDLSEPGKQPVLLAWQFPSGQVNPGFLDGLQAAGLTPKQRLFFLCRSGVRSAAAAQHAEAAGYALSANVMEGFEGHPDQYGRRGMLEGWQADGLPWRR